MMTLTDLITLAVALDVMDADTLKTSWSIGGLMTVLEDAYILKDANDDDIRWLGVFDYVTEEFRFYERPDLDEIAEFEYLLDEYHKITKIVQVIEDCIDCLI